MKALDVIRTWLPLVAMACSAAWAQEAAPPAAAEQAANAETTPAGTATAATKFLRLRRGADDQPAAMETAVTTFTPKSGEHPGLVVDLIGAVHVGDKAYYDELNRRFAAYDVVLYELVAPENARIPKPGQRSSHPVNLLQQMMKNVLELHFQLDCVDYSPKNFVHADMTPAEFAQSMKDRGESFFQIMLRAMSQSMAIQSKNKGKKMPSDAAMIMAFFSRDRSLQLKRIMAEQFEDLESQMSVLSGPNGSTLITERNKKALAVLKQQIAAGKKRIAIFYGAGHFPDMKDRLANEFQLAPTDQQWLVAWSLARQPAAATTSQEPGSEEPAEQRPADKLP